VDFVDHTLRKVVSILEEIENLTTSDFPHHDSKDALELLKTLFEGDKNRLGLASSSTDNAIRKSACTYANSHIATFLPILGFSLRSTNVRNSFEFFDPLLRLARRFLGIGAKLVLSSEWEFSPLTYPLVFSELPNFVFIGLPASEAGNALIIPLAGHELGHSVWTHENLEFIFQGVIEAQIVQLLKTRWPEFLRIFGQHDLATVTTDLVTRAIWLLAYDVAIRQCEETFCDIFGLKSFEESYLYAFEYLLAPSLGGKRDAYYPSIKDRVKFLEEAATRFSVDVHTLPHFKDRFDESPPTLDTGTKFLVDVADAATSGVVSSIIDKVEELHRGASVSALDRDRMNKICDDFRMAVPSGHAETLAEIINAAWVAYRDPAFWQDLQVHEQGFALLNELVFKTIEVMEVHIRLRA
jgi:hypothetical protein